MIEKVPKGRNLERMLIGFCPFGAVLLGVAYSHSALRYAVDRRPIRGLKTDTLIQHNCPIVSIFERFIHVQLSKQFSRLGAQIL